MRFELMPKRERCVVLYSIRRFLSTFFVFYFRDPSQGYDERDDHGTADFRSVPLVLSFHRYFPFFFFFGTVRSGILFFCGGLCCPWRG